ncbi:uncharacterized protein LOC116213909 [Punica granatum]|uniref:Uncharacterized protein LOC116213909 n=1 Tax=Punica granatum TaxID=22663 RepID=A0A6P8E4M4_PUNGR|nr:uncharacterized protein LOC116213909 [Punica granatum]XP_031404908.1 uncharacterized protein LOC116213909 [Punica granatum]XP_031404909.1 uncharacterized protein LOC116213909 [Punica granatum]
MIGIQNNKSHKNDKQFPGCLGRMVNLFDLSAGVSANRLLTDKPHRDGLSRSRSDVARILGTPAGNKREDKMVYPDLRSLPTRKSHSTPMKMLIAQEMSKEIKSKHGPSNVVAKLMGLDALPRQQHDSLMQRSQSKDYSHRILSHSGEPAQYWPQEHNFLDEGMKWKAHEYEDHGDYRDVYEIRKESRKMNSLRDKSPLRGMYSEKETRKKMELVRQKFMEAKRLAANEKLCQSKEFQDAVEVLSSNKEFFLKFLQEPDALISKHLNKLESICAPPETKRITVLKPSKMVDLEKFPTQGKKNDYPIKRPAQVVQETYLAYDIDEYANQPTRIVVLKPNAGKMSEIKSSISVASPTPRILLGESPLEAEDYRIDGSEEVVEENTCYMHRNSMGDRRDEILMSPAFGDEISFNESDDQCALESFSEYEGVSPNSRHSWDCVNGSGSPFSSSLFSRTSYYPDSSVSREAKKRLSERWAMMASSRGSLEGRRSRRSSNSLGEMLALSDMKKSVVNNGEGNEREEVSATNNWDKGVAIDMPVSLQRSRSLPASSTDYGQRNLEVLGSAANKTNSLKEPTKKSATSFKGKVSSFFFPRNKRSSKDKCTPSRSTEESQSAPADIPQSSVPAYPHDKVSYYANQFAEDTQLEECSSPDFPRRRSPDTTEMGQKPGVVFQKSEKSNIEPAMLGNSIENADQPSPISVLELPYEEGDTATTMSSGKQVPMHPLMSNLIDKSPPIESIARTLSWDDSSSGSSSPHSSEPVSHELLEQEWLSHIRKILSTAGLDGKNQWNVFSFNWHSPENPLDPSLGDKLANTEEEEPMHEAQRRRLRLNRKLVFDCVNEALVEIMGNEPTGRQGPSLLCKEPPLTLHDRVWSLIRERLSCEVTGDEWNGQSLAVEVAVRKEVVMGRGWWAENFRLEISNLGKEIEQELLRELMDETLIDLI